MNHTCAQHDPHMTRAELEEFAQGLAEWVTMSWLNGEWVSDDEYGCMAEQWEAIARGLA